jgi:hypothetical protein
MLMYRRRLRSLGSAWPRFAKNFIYRLGSARLEPMNIVEVLVPTGAASSVSPLQLKGMTIDHEDDLAAIASPSAQDWKIMGQSK